MGKYRVTINPRAIRELDQIYEYIVMEKLSPEHAKDQTDRIKAAILDLDTFSQGHQERQEEYCWWESATAEKIKTIIVK